MNLTRLIITLIIALLGIGMVALAGPLPTSSRSRHGNRGSNLENGENSNRNSSNSNSDSNNNHNNRNNSRRRKSGRQLRMLRKILRSLSSEDVRALQLRSKKDYAENNYLGPNLHHEPTEDPRYQSKIECPTAKDKMQLFACPTPNVNGVFYCIDELSLCNNKFECPNGEDENRTICMFHKVNMGYIKVFVDALLQLGPPHNIF